MYSDASVTSKISLAPIAQGEISMSVAFPTHVWKMPNICKHTIVRFFSHMFAFSRTYLSKSKHVWKKAPRCKYTNVFGFFLTCWVKVKLLPKCTCVVVYTQIWLFENIFEKMCKKTIMFYGFDLTEYLASLMTQNNFLLYWHLHYKDTINCPEKLMRISHLNQTNQRLLSIL